MQLSDAGMLSCVSLDKNEGPSALKDVDGEMHPVVEYTNHISCWNTFEAWFQTGRVWIQFLPDPVYEQHFCIN